jgi:acyl phosphate:glycerol-3-phosphate acyltransferase
VYFLLLDRVAWTAEAPVVMALFVMALLLAWRHRENINRLLKGTESKIGGRRKRSA